MINSMSLTAFALQGPQCLLATAPQSCNQARMSEGRRERESESVADVPERWVLKAPWKKDYGCLCWPSGPLPAAQVCKLLKAAELRVRSWIFFSLFTLHPRLDGWLCFVQGENPLRFLPPPPQGQDLPLKNVLDPKPAVFTVPPPSKTCPCTECAHIWFK